MANEACDNGRVTANGRGVKASYEVKPGDVLELKFGERTVKVGGAGSGGQRGQGGRLRPVPGGCCKAGQSMKRAKCLRLAALALGGAVLLSGCVTRTEPAVSTQSL